MCRVVVRTVMLKVILQHEVGTANAEQWVENSLQKNEAGALPTMVKSLVFLPQAVVLILIAVSSGAFHPIF